MDYQWGHNSKSTNNSACGFIAAVFAAAFNKPVKCYAVTAAASMTEGDAEVRLIIKPSLE
jgi:hypothetical protein